MMLWLVAVGRSTPWSVFEVRLQRRSKDTPNKTDECVWRDIRVLWLLDVVVLQCLPISAGTRQAWTSSAVPQRSWFTCELPSDQVLQRLQEE